MQIALWHASRRNTPRPLGRERPEGGQRFTRQSALEERNSQPHGRYRVKARAQGGPDPPRRLPRHRRHQRRRGRRRGLPGTGPERHELIRQAQKIEYEEDGYIVWGSVNLLDAHGTRVHGIGPTANPKVKVANR